MPELPEVEVVRRGVDDWTTSRRIETVSVHHPRAVRRHLAGPQDFVGRLTGALVRGTGRRGKYMWLDLDSGDLLVVHLGMSGQLRIVAPGTIADPHLRVRIGFADGRDELHFIDQRTFGALFLDQPVGPDGVPSRIAHIARDPFDPLFDASEVTRRIRLSSSPIKALLLDQNIVAGVGNIYADEALWRSKINWERPGRSLPTARVKHLLANAAQVMTEALEVGGTSFDALYVNINGTSGYFSRSLVAYGQAGMPCPRCGTVIIRERFANRSSFRCPRCQRRSRRPVTGGGRAASSVGD
ncbi:MAG: bifunctional DNA-formamidopyrimidine glycosylase/DNA-(apurinic or apyrimidinic site) lyase [Candidatus Nanopelagicales bacterium]|nr:bifunctional DNA-formamidopyrimidine glycosylase/DNA-(apurinic or apyrimidinic site) lyase [Candidatus Nanopelagicales bacterium]